MTRTFTGLLILLIMSPAIALYGQSNDYPHSSSSCNSVDQWNFYKRQCTSFVAWRMNRDAGNTSSWASSYPFHNHNWGAGAPGANCSFNPGQRLSHACYWDDVLQNAGYSVNNIPNVGAIAHWNAYEAGATWAGHVAYVYAVNPNGTVVIEEYNWATSCGYGTRTVAASAIPRYIHFTSNSTSAPAGPVLAIPSQAESPIGQGGILTRHPGSDYRTRQFQIKYTYPTGGCPNFNHHKVWTKKSPGTSGTWSQNIMTVNNGSCTSGRIYLFQKQFHSNLNPSISDLQYWWLKYDFRSGSHNATGEHGREYPIPFLWNPSGPTTATANSTVNFSTQYHREQDVYNTPATSSVPVTHKLWLRQVGGNWNSTPMTTTGNPSPWDYASTNGVTYSASYALPANASGTWEYKFDFAGAGGTKAFMSGRVYTFTINTTTSNHDFYCANLSTTNVTTSQSTYAPGNQLRIDVQQYTSAPNAPYHYPIDLEYTLRTTTGNVISVLGDDHSSLGGGDAYDDETKTVTVGNSWPSSCKICAEANHNGMVAETNHSNNLLCVNINVAAPAGNLSTPNLSQSCAQEAGNVTRCSPTSSNCDCRKFQARWVGSPAPGTARVWRRQGSTGQWQMLNMAVCAGSPTNGTYQADFNFSSTNYMNWEYKFDFNNGVQAGGINGQNIVYAIPYLTNATGPSGCVTSGIPQSFSVKYWHKGGSGPNGQSPQYPTVRQMYIHNGNAWLGPYPMTLTSGSSPATGLTYQVNFTPNGCGTFKYKFDFFDPVSKAMKAGCEYTFSVVAPPNTPTASSTSICAGQSVTLSAFGGCGTAVWYRNSCGMGSPVFSGNSGTVSPTNTTTYYVRSQNNGCNSSCRSVTVNVTQTNVSATPSNANICEGTSIQLNAIGATSYQWSPATGLSCTNCPNPVASPTTSRSYTVTGTTNGCSSTATVQVNVQSVPNVNGTAGNYSICAGSSTQLNGFGATSYTWAPNNNTLSCTNCPNPTATPSATTTYVVTGSIGNCSSTDTVRVTVNTPPVIAINAANNPICQGNTTTLSASSNHAGTTYNWTPSVGLNCVNCPTPVASPSISTTYTVTGTDINGCIDTDTVYLQVDPWPNVVGTATDYSICVGSPTSLVATGGSTYTWSPSTGLSCTNCSNPTASPGTDITYTVTGTGTNSCSQTDTVHIVVNATPTVVASTASQAVCPGNGTSLNAYSNQPGTSFTWSPASNLSCNTCPSPVAMPSTTTTYVTTGINASGCSDTDSVTVVVYSPMSLNATPAPAQMCQGDTIEIFAHGASAYNWLPQYGIVSTNGNIVKVAPQMNTSYTVIGTDSNGCIDSLSVAVTVNAPTIPTVSHIGGQLIASSGSAYQWYQNGLPLIGETNSSLTINNMAGTFTVLVTDSNGCSAMSVGTLIVGTEAPAVPNLVEIYPNPNQGRISLQIQNSEFGNVNILIYDVMGRQIWQQTSRKDGTVLIQTIELVHLAQGYYYVQVTTPHGKRYIQKIIRQ